MATHYVENEANANQYYFDSNNNATSQANRQIQNLAYNTPVTVASTVSPSEYSPYSAGVSGARVQPQQSRSDRNVFVENDSYQLPQQHQSVAGFNKSIPQQQYQSSPTSIPHVKATVRTVNSPDQHQQYMSSAQFQQPQQRQQQVYSNYEQQNSSSLSNISPQQQQQQYQYDSRTPVGQPVSLSGHYQVPTSAQYTHHESTQRTDSPSQGYDNHTQAQQVPVRLVTNSSHEQYEGSGTYQQQHTQQPLNSQPSPKPAQQEQQHEDQLQQYYSQLTPEQYQQLLRHQQIQRQQQEEQKRQQLAQQQYYLQQERQRSEQQQQQNQLSRSTQESQHYDNQQSQHVQQSSSNQDVQHRQQGHNQYDIYQCRPQQIQSAVSLNTSQDYRPQIQTQHQQGQSDAYYEQQHRVATHQAPVSPTQQQDQYRSKVNIVGGQQHQQISSNQQQRIRTDSERQHQEEEDYYAAQIVRQQQQEREHTAQIEALQRQQTASRVQQQQHEEQQQQQQQQQQHQIIQTQQTAQPVGIRGLMNKFTGPTKIPTYEPSPKTRTTQQYSTSSHISSSGPNQKSTTTIQNSKLYTMTYSALPKPQEPPVNSAEYFQMLQQGTINNTPSPIQSAAPPHIQGSAPGFGALRDRFKGASTSNNTNSIQNIHHHHQQQPQSNAGNSSLSSLRTQYMNRATEAIQSQEEPFAQKIQTVSQSAVRSEQSSQQQQQQQKISIAQISSQEELQAQSQSIDDPAVSSDGAMAEGGSSSGASPFENDTNSATAVPISN